MKLRNKKTGEIVEFKRVDLYEGYGIKLSAESLAELNEEWEDISEEPKEYWYVEPNGVIARIDEWGCCTEADKEIMKHIGNYFETKEEAKRAVEKLKAWKRLKDKGFKFIGVRGICKAIDFEMPKPYNHVAFDEYNANENELEFYNDLMLLFGGEE